MNAGASAACPPSEGPSPAPVLEAMGAARAAGRMVTILTIGSSSTAGVGASDRRTTSFPAVLAHRLVEAWGEGTVEVINAGVSGETGPATLKRLTAFLAQAEKPQLVVWQVGTNDVLFGGRPDRLSKLVGEGLDAASAAGVPVILVDQQYFPAARESTRYEEFVGAVDSAAAARGTPLLSRYAMMRRWAIEDPQGFAASLSWDRFHMSDAGYACLGASLADAVLAAVAAAPKAAPSAAPAGRAQADGGAAGGPAPGRR